MLPSNIEMSVSITNINKSISDVRSVRAKNGLVALFSAAHNVICFYLVVRRTNMIGFKSLFSLFCIKSNNSFVLWNFMYLKMPNDMRLGRGTITWLGYFMGMCEWIMQWMVKNRSLSLSRRTFQSVGNWQWNKVSKYIETNERTIYFSLRLIHPHRISNWAPYIELKICSALRTQHVVWKMQHVRRILWECAQLYSAMHFLFSFWWEMEMNTLVEV